MMVLIKGSNIWRVGDWKDLRDWRDLTCADIDSNEIVSRDSGRFERLERLRAAPPLGVGGGEEKGLERLERWSRICVDIDYKEIVSIDSGDFERLERLRAASPLEGGGGEEKGLERLEKL